MEAGALIQNASTTFDRTITYTYDPLNRLTAADYDDGTYFHYNYDAVGNRLSEVTDAGTNTYVYDVANRLWIARAAVVGAGIAVGCPVAAKMDAAKVFFCVRKRE